MNPSLDNQLLDAVVSDNQNIVSRLLQRGANVECVSAFQQTPLELAIDNNLLEMAEFLLENGSNPNSTYGNSLPLITAIDAAVETSKNNDDVESDSIEMIELLLEYGADILQVDPNDGKNAYEFAKDYHIPAQRLFEQRLGLSSPQ